MLHVLSGYLAYPEHIHVDRNHQTLLKDNLCDLMAVDWSIYLQRSYDICMVECHNLPQRESCRI